VPRDLSVAVSDALKELAMVGGGVDTRFVVKGQREERERRIG